MSKTLQQSAITEPLLEKERDAQTPPANPNHGLFGMVSSRSSEILGLGATALFGSLAAFDSIRQSFYKNISRYHVFDDLRDKRNADFTNIYKEFQNKNDRVGLTNAINTVEKRYTADVEVRLKSYGINNVLDRWNTLKSHQKNEVILAFSGVSAVFLGVVASLSASRRVEERQESLRQQITDDRDKNNGISR